MNKIADMSRNIIFILTSMFFFLSSTMSLGEEKESKQESSFKLLRSDESYSYLANQNELSDWETFKYIPLNKANDIVLTLGGEFRPRFELFNNRLWDKERDQNYYSHRLALHSNIQFGEKVRFFSELYHGFVDEEEEFAESDKVDLHQGFIEYQILNDGVGWKYTLGRQELALGAARLVGIREGPNIRRSFDMIKVQRVGNLNLQFFLGKEVIPSFDAFDNGSNFFGENNRNNPTLWGIYSKFKIKGDVGSNELYLLGFDVDSASYNDITDEERRYTLGLRRFGTIGEGFQYNTELMYQFGDVGPNDIEAFNIETDWHYHFRRYPMKPSLGLKLEWSTGDNKVNDGEINTFNPMFVNPNYYGISEVITPANIISIHPSLTLHPTNKVQLYFEWAVFKRESNNDGLYRVTRFISRDANLGDSNSIGEQFGTKVKYEINNHWSFDIDISYFKAGRFLKQSGDSENILHVSSQFKFIF
ncbi:alginate export family protein [Kangiella sp. HZ709]|uniref:alginate export family protein n=1 Tax=Kangiella sp. HZ709 TaxID=2666328 RepID=UPI0018A1EF83|nr:alginate export family protein [Kangiella sp. HZ709]